MGILLAVSLFQKFQSSKLGADPEPPTFLSEGCRGRSWWTPAVLRAALTGSVIVVACCSSSCGALCAQQHCPSFLCRTARVLGVRSSLSRHNVSKFNILSLLCPPRSPAQTDARACEVLRLVRRPRHLSGRWTTLHGGQRGRTGAGNQLRCVP